MDQAAEEEAHSHDEQEVGQDGAEHGRLDDLDLAIPEGNNADLADVSQHSVSTYGGALTISSTAFPNVAFKSPPRVSPSLREISSVANERTAASGMMAKKLMVKTAVGFHPEEPATMPMGTMMSKKLT